MTTKLTLAAATLLALTSLPLLATEWSMRAGQVELLTPDNSIGSAGSEGSGTLGAATVAPSGGGTTTKGTTVLPVELTNDHFDPKTDNLSNSSSASVNINSSNSSVAAIHSSGSFSDTCATAQADTGKTHTKPRKRRTPTPKRTPVLTPGASRVPTVATSGTPLPNGGATPSGY